VSADPIDKGCEIEEMLREVALQRRRPEAPKGGGTCLFCEEKIEPHRRWCDSWCRDQWERENG
jgi:hypothetical protein